MENAAGLSRAASRWRTPAAVLAAVLVAFASTVVAADESEAARLAAAARDAAERDDHAAAIRLATDALALDPALEPELTLLLAQQLTWADRPAEAVPFYRRALARDPADREATLGLARALSWADRLDEARAVYEGLVARDATDTEARLGVVRMHAWNDEPAKAAAECREILAVDPHSSEARRALADAENRAGRHRAAEKSYLALLEADGEDAEAREGLARARYWLGEGEAALATIEPLGSREATALREEIARERGMRWDLSASRWIDRDDQELETAGLQGDFDAGHGRRIVAEVHGFRADEPGTPAIDGARYGTGLDVRIDRSWAVHGRAAILDAGFGLDGGTLVDVGEGETRTAQEARARRLLWDGWVTWTPLDRTRFDLSHSRIPIMTPRALARGIRADVLGLGADRTLRERLAGSASVSWSDYTDGNTRIAGEAELVAGPFRPYRRTRAWIGAGVAAFTFDEAADRGYYAPETYDAVYAMGRLAAPFGRRVTVETDLRLASEREESDGRFGVASGGAELRIALGGGFTFGAFARTSTSRLDSGAGYERDGVGASLSFGP